VIIVDEALKAREAAGQPIRVGMIGAGFMGKAIAHHLVRRVPGMTLAAIANRTVARAEDALAAAGCPEVVRAGSSTALEDAIRRDRPAVTDDPSLLCTSDGIDVILEVTGSIEHAAHAVVEAIDHGKHVVLMNAELDGTVGAELARRAERAGVVLTACDGDQPGVEANLVRFVRGLGLEPLVCGNIKGLQDPYRNPTTQQGFAERWGQNVHMVTSFADGTKISFEQAIVANAFGFTVERRGMRGSEHDGHVDELVDRYDVDELRELGGVVDYVVGSQPSPGVFVLAAEDETFHRHYLELYKLGTGPLYSFYTPYHLCHFEVPTSIARAALFHDPVLRATGEPTVDVVATAKVDLDTDTVLDGIGGYHTYGQAERASVTRRERLLPMGLAEGCRLTRPVPRDAVLTYDDVEVPPGRLVDRLRATQDATLHDTLRGG
jgi:predicted homoserine dehydrogenase-like protein